MQAKCTTPRRSGLRHLLGAVTSWIFRRGAKTDVTPRAGDVPDYLRRDVGLSPRVQRGRQSGDPPVRDPFWLL